MLRWIDRAWERGLRLGGPHIPGKPAVFKGIRWNGPRLRRSCQISWKARSAGPVVAEFGRGSAGRASDSGSAACWLRGLGKLLFIHPLGSGWTSEGPWGVARVAVCAKTSTGRTCKGAMTEGSPVPERASRPLARCPGWDLQGPRLEDSSSAPWGPGVLQLFHRIFTTSCFTFSGTAYNSPNLPPSNGRACKHEAPSSA